MSPFPPARKIPPQIDSPVTEERKVKFALPVAFTVGMLVMFMDIVRAPEGMVVE